MSKMIQLRNVPDDLHRVLKSRAALAGKSLSDYLIAEIRRHAERPTIEELRRRLWLEPGSAECATGSNDPGRTGQAVIVADASAVLELLLGTTAAYDIQRRLFESGESLHAPHLIDLEIAQVLRRYVLIGELTPQRGLQALTDLGDLPIFATRMICFFANLGTSSQRHRLRCGLPGPCRIASRAIDYL